MTVSAKWRTLLLLALAELLAMGLWFSASAVVPSLRQAWGLTPGQASWLTMAVQIGFVAGGVVSALFNMADVMKPRVLFAWGAVVGAAANATIPLSDGFEAAVALRFVTGMSLAAVYPVGMKIMATWTREDRGLGLGLLVGALTVGSATPHLLKGLGDLEAWQQVLYAGSALALAGALLALLFGHLGPYRAPTASFEWRRMGHAFSDRHLRLANFGYLGHMWEVYAMWTWIPFYLAAVYAAAWPEAPGATQRWGAIAGFGAIAVGGLGCLVAGRLSDRLGRTTITIASLTISGGCAVAIGLLFHSPVLATAIAMLWGFVVVADSAQFSTAVSELADPRYVGTQLTTQTTAGFLLTLVTIRAVAELAELVGWRWSFAVLAVGPVFGIWAMMRLRSDPSARAKLAGGKG